MVELGTSGTETKLHMHLTEYEKAHIKCLPGAILNSLSSFWATIRTLSAK